MLGVALASLLINPFTPRLPRLRSSKLTPVGAAEPGRALGAGPSPASRAMRCSRQSSSFVVSRRFMNTSPPFSPSPKLIAAALRAELYAQAAVGNQRSAAGRYVHATHPRAPRTSRQHAIVSVSSGTQPLNS